MGHDLHLALHVLVLIGEELRACQRFNQPSRSNRHTPTHQKVNTHTWHYLGQVWQPHYVKFGSCGVTVDPTKWPYLAGDVNILCSTCNNREQNWNNFWLASFSILLNKGVVYQQPIYKSSKDEKKKLQNPKHETGAQFWTSWTTDL